MAVFWTAPTNGAAGVVPAVPAIHPHFHEDVDQELHLDLLLTLVADRRPRQSQRSSIFGAEVGCQWGQAGSALAMAGPWFWRLSLAERRSDIENAAEIAL